MLGPDEKDYIFQRAYIPEHLPDYVAGITGMEAFLFRNHVLYRHGEVLVFVGYPLEVEFTEEGTAGMPGQRPSKNSDLERYPSSPPRFRTGENRQRRGMRMHTTESI